jgi:DNA helicase II / ATP-dependent DNA helicase PcrA
MAHGLNPEQQQAVETLRGPMLVLAGAGSGKTRVVTFRIANLIRHGTPAERILAVTFTNKAAKEMKERVGKVLGQGQGQSRRRAVKKDAPAEPVVGTFHANCVKILRRHAKRLGYPDKFAIYDRGDQETVAREVLRQLRVHSGMLKPGDFLSHVSRWKSRGVRPDEAFELAKSDAEHVAASGYRRYQQALKLGGVMDFDDLLLLTEDLFRDHEEVRKLEAERFDHVLVDEYQDTNTSQYSIIRQLVQGHRNLCVVGDDDQSIYGWRGAEVQHILNFRNDWPEAKVIRLEANYRSTGPILQMANTLIGFNKTRHSKVLRAERPAGPKPRILQFKNEVEEAHKIVEEIGRTIQHGHREPRDFAILFRTKEQPRVFEMELRRARIPFTLIGSQSFFDRREVRDIVSYLKVLDNPRDEVALLRIINNPQRGIGPKSIETLLGWAVNSGKSVWEAMHEEALVGGFPEPARRGVASFKGIINRFQSRLSADTAGDAASRLSQIASELVQEIQYLPTIERLYNDPEEAQDRKNSVEEVINSLAEYEGQNDSATLASFLDDAALGGKEFASPKEKQLQQNAVSLMTYHSAKGLEFPLVYMVGMEEGVLPHRRSLAESDDVEEERRLCYVGITRAQDELTLSLPLERKKWGKERPTFVSRFLYEMTGQADNPNRMKAIHGARKEIRRDAGAGSAAKKRSGKR